MVFAKVLATPLVAQSRVSDAVPDRELSGRIHDIESQPVEGARIWVVDVNSYETDDVPTAQTDADGRFRITIPRSFLQPRPYQAVAAIVAHHPSHGLASLAFGSVDAIPDRELVLEFPRASPTPVIIQSPDGEPVADAGVTVSVLACERLEVGLSPRDTEQYASAWKSEPRETPWGVIAGRYPINVPDELQDRLQVTSGPNGRADIAVPIEAISTLSVETPEIGRQSFTRNMNLSIDADKPIPIPLLRPIPITGQLVGAQDLVGGKRVRVFGGITSFQPGVFICSSQHFLTTDPSGRFEVTGFEGDWYATAEWDIDSPLRPAPASIAVKPGQENRLEIPLKPAVRVFGYVRDTDGKGAPGVRINLWIGENHSVVTDDNGQYEVAAAPGQLVVASILSESYFPEVSPLQHEAQEVSGEQFEIEPISVRPAMVAQGNVVDENGQPVAGAEVRATWYGYSPPHFRIMLNQKVVDTDEEGRFVIGGIDKVDVAPWCFLAARKGDAVTRGASPLKENEPLTLMVSPDQAVHVRGRVMDGSGAPVADAALELWYQPHRPHFVDAAAVQIRFGESDRLTTNDAGEFTSPAVWPDGEYRAKLVDERFEPAASAWVNLADGSESPLDDLIARRLGAHLGAVTNRDGAPVSNARVTFQGGGRRLEAQTDGEGRFKFEEAPDGPGYLFVDAEGYRFHGQKRTTWEPLAIKLLRDDQPYGEKLEMAEPRMSAEERKNLARQLRDELLAGAKDDAVSRVRVLAAWAKADPREALRIVAADKAISAELADRVRFEAAKALMDTSPDEAAELVDQMTYEHMRSIVYGQIAANLPHTAADRRLELLAEAYARAEAIKEPGFRLITLGFVAENLLDMGQRDRARAILLDNAETAKKLTKSGYDAFLRGAFAEELAQVDRETAVALADEIEDWYERSRHLGNIAHELAAIEPAEAERVLAMITPPPEGSNHFPQKDSYTVRACYRMVQVDAQAAEAVAEGMADALYKAHACGVMAAAIAKEDSGRATTFVRRGFQILDEQQRTGDPDRVWPITTGAVGGMLLVQSQQIDPELGAEMLWRLLALLPEAPAKDGRGSYQQTESLAVGAMFLSLFDSDLAEEVLLRAKGSQSVGSSRAYLPAWGLIDPHVAVQEINLQDQRQRYSSKLSLIVALTATGAERLRFIEKQGVLWSIDDEDTGL
jgi:protocatechuate 3,4-dioxygenase beta subunit